MGYTTQFAGAFTISPPLPEALVKKINEFCRKAHNDTQISVWCDWQIHHDGTSMSWNGAEKSYGMDEWAQFIIDNFIPDGHNLGGVVRARGEDFADFWHMTIKNGRDVVRKSGWPNEG